MMQLLPSPAGVLGAPNDAVKLAIVERLAVGDHAVEVEDDGPHRHFFMRSPARMGIFNRFSAGGYGHS